MALTVQTIANWSALTLGASDALSSVDLVNHAGEHLVNAHQWVWLRQRSTQITPRGNVSVVGNETVFMDAGISSDTRGNRLTFEAATGIDTYVFNVGDKINLTAQAPSYGDPGVNGAVLGEHKIVAKVADNAIIIEGNANLDSGRFSYVSGEIITDSVALPADFRDLIAIDGQQTDRRTLQPTTLVHMNRLRSDNSTSSEHFWGAVSYGSHNRVEYGSGAGSGSTATSVAAAQSPVPILEIWPNNASESLTLMYRAGWTRVDADDSYVLIPQWLEPCFIQLVQHFAHGYLEKDERSMALRIMEWQTDPLTVDAKRRDGQMQGNYGMMRGGVGQRQGYGHHPMDSDYFRVTF